MPEHTISTAKVEGKDAGKLCADFRNQETFPTFHELPRDDGIDLTFYDAVNGFYYTPQKHWCFLAEIIGIETFIRVRFVVQDKVGTEVPIAIYTDGRGSELNPSQLQLGHTIAVLYANQHGFMDLTKGIRQEEIRGIQIISTPLSELLQLSDRVQSHSAKPNEMVCHGCDQKKTSLQKCSTCSLFWYCDKSCQSVGWNERGHKRDCKIIRENNLRPMFLMDWDHFDDFVTFPLPNSSSSVPRQDGRLKDREATKSGVHGLILEALDSETAVTRGLGL